MLDNKSNLDILSVPCLTWFGKCGDMNILHNSCVVVACKDSHVFNTCLLLCVSDHKCLVDDSYKFAALDFPVDTDEDSQRELIDAQCSM